MRDDTILNTGMNSQSFGTAREQPQRTEKREEKQAKKSVLLPSESVINKELDAIQEEQMVALKNLVLGVGDSEDSVKAELRALQMNMKFVEQVKTRLSNVIRNQA